MLSPILTTLLLSSQAAVPGAIPEHPVYNRDVRPILADACFRCHGFDKNTREADRRLDQREGAMADLDGVRAIVPGKPEESALLTRLHTADADDVMPPPKEARQLTAAEKEILKRWIAQGAEYQDHWAYIPPAAPAYAGPVEGGIDHFISARLASLGIPPAAEASRAVLVRRLSFDLTGLPPTAEEVRAFVNDTAPDAWPKLVGRFLTKPAHGERMAVWWLDQTRYADTIGYHSDNPMPVSPWRDYVIAAFNANKPFDRFTIEQVAGDLLPDATLQTRVASAYNRLILSTEEGGAQPGQYEAKYLTDRVKSIGTTWLGQTLMCAECHDHKYDPVTTKDFYALGAFFADIEEAAVGKRGDGVPVLEEKAQSEHAALVERSRVLEADLAAPHPELAGPQAAWEQQTLAALNAAAQWQPLKFSAMEAPHGIVLEQAADAAVLSKAGSPGEATYTLTASGLSGAIAGLRIEALPHDSLPAKGPGRAGNGNFVLTEVRARLKRAGGNEEPVRFTSARADWEQSSHGDGTPYQGWRAAAVIDDDKHGKVPGWAILPQTGTTHYIILGAEKPVTVAAGDQIVVELAQTHSGDHRLGHFRVSYAASAETVNAAGALPPQAILDFVRKPAAERDEAQRTQLAEHYRSIAPELAAQRDELAAVKQKVTALEAAAPRCLITTAMPNPRTVRVLPRGDWQNTTGETVLPATPAFLPGRLVSTPEKRLNRLDLAQWLVTKENPLTARVFVNRLWKLFYGQGLVKTLDDIGTQSELPEHQPLLDWLAHEFTASGWNVRHMVRLMVGSAAYRRSSTTTPEMLARDPQNRELARGGRWRLDAEFVRDNALAISGLLAPRIGGPSVKPYQPAGYWENLNFPTREWQSSGGEDSYRRGLYTWWQRSYVHPAMLAFDAPTREECSADRPRSNIPQQALVLLNDAVFVEAARAFAVRIMIAPDPDGSDAARIRRAWHDATGRDPDEKETAILMDLLARHRAHFLAHPEDAARLLTTGQAPVPEALSRPELAAFTAVCRTLLNLHETITRP